MRSTRKASEECSEYYPEIGCDASLPSFYLPTWFGTLFHSENKPPVKKTLIRKSTVVTQRALPSIPRSSSPSVSSVPLLSSMSFTEMDDHMPPPPEFRFQTLITCMKELNYHVDFKGVCFGYGHMSMHAILANNIEIFNQRMTTVIAMAYSLPARLNNDITNDPDKELLVDMRALFDGIALYQSPRAYSDFFAPGAACSQNVRLVAPYVLPTQLDESGGIVQTFCSTGIYSLADIFGYFNSLYDVLNNAGTTLTQPFSLVLSCSDHVLTVGYNPITQKWLYADPIRCVIDTIDAQDIRMLSEKVMSELCINTAYATDRRIAFSTTAYGVDAEKSQLLALIQQWRNHEGHRNIQMVFPDKVHLDCKDTSWLQLAIKYNQEDVVKALISAGARINDRFPTGDTPLLYAACRGLTSIVKALLDVGVDLDAQREGCTAQEMAELNGHQEIVSMLVEARANKAPDYMCGSTSYSVKT